ncbi:extracellular solute-binding protein 3 [Tanacetum coccineum]
MERKDYVIAFFVTFLCVSCIINVVVASKVSTEKTVTDKAYSKVHFIKTRTTFHDTSSRRKRSVKEQGDIGHADVCARAKSKMIKLAKSPCPTLVVWVPKTSVTQFVKINDQNEVVGGFSIAIFCYALRSLPYNVQPIFKPFIDDKGEMNGTYDQLLRQIEGQTCEAVAGDVTIRGNRAQYVSFTIPYMSIKVYMLVRASHEWIQSLWTFLRPFTTRLWLTLVCACFLTGVALVFLEFREDNPEFASPFYMQLIMVIWFPVLTFFFHEGRIRNKCSKVVLVMWLGMIFIVLQIFTATLSSWLTLDHLIPSLPSFEYIGYQNGSYLKDLVIQQYHSSEKHLVPLNTIEEYKNALSNGSVNVIFDELPYIDLFLYKYGSDYAKFGPMNQECGMAFVSLLFTISQSVVILTLFTVIKCAFSIGSPLLHEFSMAVINVTESNIMMKMKKRYLGFSIPDTSQSDQTFPQIDVQSFMGLFIFMAIVIIAAILWSEISIKRKKNKVGIVNRDRKKTRTRRRNPKPELIRAGQGMLIGLRGGFGA